MIECGYEWWHSTAAGRELIHCTREQGHEGKHENEE